MMKLKTLLGTLAAFTILSVTAVYAMDRTTSGLDDKTRDFIQKATMGNEFEILSSQEAIQRAQDTKVKEFAQKMIDDHTQVGEDLKVALKEADLSSSITEPVVLDSDHQEKLDDLKKSDANSFDDDYIDAQNDAHEDAVDLFRDYSEDGKNAALKAFAAKTLPALEMHKKQVEALNDELDKK
jgi:putative membrane protein